MPRIDPLQLLNCLNVLLTPTGGIKSEQEVSRISSLMEKFSKKLVSKCVYLLILKASDVQLLSMFMGANGWNLIYNWLVQAIEAKNYPFLVELLEVIIMCPVDIERLKSNPMPRQIKYLSKDNSIEPKVKELASDIVKHWLAIVKGAPAVNQQQTSNVSEPDSATNAEQPVTAAVQPPEVVDVDESDAHDSRVSSNDSQEEEEEHGDTNYVKSTSPSSDSVDDSDDQDDFVPYKKQSPAMSAKKKAAKTAKLAVKKEKQSRKSNTTVGVEKPTTKLKSKLVNDAPSKDQKKAPIKLKIEKKRDEELSNKKPRKISDSGASAIEKAIDEKIKEKRRLREEKEREKFSRLKHEREKKELKLSSSKEKRDKLDKLNKEKLDEKAKGDLSKLIPKPLDKLGRIPKLSSKENHESTSASSKTNDAHSDDAKRKEHEAKNDKSSTAAKSTDDKKGPKKEKDEAMKQTIQRLKEEREREAAKKEAKKATLPVPPKKPVSMSVEKRFAAGESKPKTVKAYNSKFRLTGLEQEMPKPPSRKQSTSTSSSLSSSTAALITTAAISTPVIDTIAPAATSPTSNEKNPVKRSPTKDIDIEPVEKKMKSPDITLEDKSPIQNKNKKPFLQESDDFMNAMNAAVETQKELLRKRKKPATKNDDGSSPSPKTPEGKDMKPAFKFYKDTLESSVDESLNESVTESLPDTKLSPDEKEISLDEEVKPPVIKSAEGLKSALSLFRKRNQPKKSVKWRADDELEAVQFFEVDVSERANVVKDFWAMQLKERSAERESMLMVRKAGENDKMTEKIAWKKLVPIDLPPPSTVKGANSQEKNIQYARERAVTPALYYSKSMIPDTPAEPDLEIHSVTQPPSIPLDDISGTLDSVNDFSTFKWPEPKQFPPDGSEFMPPNFIPGAVPPPMFAFPDGTFAPPFTQPFFPGAPVPPAGTWPTGTTDQSQQSAQSGQPMQWMRPPFEGVPPPNMVPPVGPGMMAPPPFGMMAPVFPFPGAPNMFPPPGMTPPITNNNTNSNTTDTNAQFSPTNNYSNNSDSSSTKKWNNDDRYNRKDWKNNYSGDRSNRDKRGSGTWRASGGNSRLCKYYQKKGYCNSSGCRFYHPEK
ncbi:serine/threonine-protein phosphatase 1 regulatory subunit 10-like [Planococcus citri]|uniref:serine/threonine-protein phosphatase 1 regulatory subunit 10-like n=1 Tax=Planococcus citri TaxID=170843 RepID=UPI0031F7EEBB